jgi:DNA-binding beta-propeller fold protein YncE
VYVTNSGAPSVSVLSVGPDLATTTPLAPVIVSNIPGTFTEAVSVTPNGEFVYVTGGSPGKQRYVWVIETATNELFATVELGGTTSASSGSVLGQFLALPAIEFKRDPLPPRLLRQIYR